MQPGDTNGTENLITTGGPKQVGPSGGPRRHAVDPDHVIRALINFSARPVLPGDTTGTKNLITGLHGRLQCSNGGGRRLGRTPPDPPTSAADIPVIKLSPSGGPAGTAAGQRRVLNRSRWPPPVPHQAREERPDHRSVRAHLLPTSCGRPPLPTGRLGRSSACREPGRRQADVSSRYSYRS